MTFSPGTNLILLGYYHIRLVSFPTKFATADKNIYNGAKEEPEIVVPYTEYLRPTPYIFCSDDVWAVLNLN